MVLADAGHQMKRQSCIYMFFNIIGGGSLLDHKLGNGKISLKEYGAIETKGGLLQFVDKESSCCFSRLLL
jgi:hypothetical protein